MPLHGFVGRQRQHAERRAVARAPAHHRLGHERIAVPAPDGIPSVDPLDHLPVGLGRRTHRSLHEALELVRHRPARLVHDRGGPDRCAGTHVNAVGSQRDQRSGRSGLIVDPDPNRDRASEQRRAHRVGRVDQTAVRIHLNQHRIGAHFPCLGKTLGGQTLDRRHDRLPDREHIDQRTGRGVPRAERRDRAQREQQRQEFSFHGGYRYERLRGIAARSGDSAYSHFFQRKNR